MSQGDLRSAFFLSGTSGTAAPGAGAAGRRYAIVKLHI